MSKNNNDSVDEKTFLDHLDELRTVIIALLIAIFVGMIASFSFLRLIFNILFHPFKELLKNYPETPFALIALSPSESMLVSVKIACIFGLVLAFPFIFYKLWTFVLPALKSKERKYLKIVSAAIIVLFSAGVVFCYLIVFPLCLSFLWRYTLYLDILPSWTASYYLNFALGFLLAFGLAFELPVVVLLLAKFGFVSEEYLRSKRKHMIILLFVLAALLTPPDIVSQVLLALPLLWLYDLSIFVTKFVKKHEDENIGKDY